MSSSDIFVFAGEVSGDLHGEKLLKSLFDQNPNLKIMGVGGPKMRQAGLQCVMPMEDFQVMGFIDVFMALPKLMRQFYAIRKAILSENPKAVVFIDYPGFNLRMADHLRKKGYTGKLCHYICPSVWAWGKKRIPHMAKTLDLLLTILPFEQKYFQNTSLSVQYVGHPLLQKLATYNYLPLAVPSDKKLIAIFPGSRTKEILRNFPLHLRVAKRLLLDDKNLIFGVSISHPRFLPLLKEIIKKEGLSENEVMLIEPNHSYDLMKQSYLAIAKSGTVTLELALHQIPTVVTYGISKLDFFIAYDLLRIRLPYYSLPNIIFEGEVYKELFGPNLTEESLYQGVNKLLKSEEARNQCLEKCALVRERLQDKDASQEAAEKVLNLLS